MISWSIYGHKCDKSDQQQTRMYIYKNGETPLSPMAIDNKRKSTGDNRLPAAEDELIRGLAD